MRIVEGADAQAGQSVEVQDLLEVADPVRGEIQLAQGDQAVQSDANLLDVITSDV